MKRVKILITAVFLAMVMMLPTVVDMATADTYFTREAAVNWLRQQEGREDCQVDNNGKWCTDLVTAWMNYCEIMKYHGGSGNPWSTYPNSTAHAYKYDDNYLSDPHWEVITRTSSTEVLPGDIFVSEAGANCQWGHVGIVLEPNGSIGATVIQMDQDTNPKIEYAAWGSGTWYNAEHLIRFKDFDSGAIVSQPTDTSANIGSTYSFWVGTKGTGLTYTWYYKRKNNSDFVKSAISGNRFSGTTTSSDNGMQVYCAVTDQEGKTINTRTAVLTVTLRIKTDLADTAVPVGDTFSFTADAYGSYIRYEWYCKKSNENSFSKVSSTSSVYSGTAGLDLNEMQVYCVMTDENGASGTTETVTLYVTPVIVTQPADVSVPYYDDYSFSVTAVGDGLTYEWYQYTSNDPGWLSSFHSYESTLLINMATEYHDDTVVYCVITDKNGYSVESRHASVIVMPKITSKPRADSCTEGDIFRFYLNVIGIDLRYEWYCRVDANDSFVLVSQEENYSDIAHMSQNGMEVYCVIYDKHGIRVQSDTGTLSVTRMLRDSTVAVSDTFTFTATNKGDDYHYAWYYKCSDEEGFELSSITDSTFTGQAKTADNGMQVYCVISNESDYYFVSSAATLTVLPKITKWTSSETWLKVGETYKFAVEAIGDGLSYEWYYRPINYQAEIESGQFNNAYAHICWNIDLSQAEGATLLPETSPVLTGIVTEHSMMDVCCVIKDINGNKTFSCDCILIHSEVVLQPSDAYISGESEGSEVTFKVQATGVGPLRYQWQVYVGNGEWSNLQTESAKTDTLVFTATSDDVGKSFRCDVRDGLGLGTVSDSAKVRLIPTFSIEGYFSDAVGGYPWIHWRSEEEVNSYVVYRCSAKLDPNNDASWGDPIVTLSRDFPLYIDEDATNETEYYYRVKRVAVYGEDYSNYVLISTLSFDKQPKDYYAFEGASFYSTVYANGMEVEYEWFFRRSSNGTQSSWIKDDEKRFYFNWVSLTQEDDGLQYYATATDKFGRSVQSAIGKIGVFSNPQDTTVWEGDIAEFSVDSVYADKVTYQWQYKSPTSAKFKNSTQTGANTSKLSVKTNANHHEYQYQCVITDAEGNVSISNPAVLTIASEIVSQPTSKTLTVGGFTVFSVEVNSSEIPEYQWQYKAPGTSTWRNSTQDGAKTSTLSVELVENVDGYQYRCVVTLSESGKQIVSRIATLIILPEIIAHPTGKTVVVGDTAVFSVAVNLNKTFKYQWQCKAPKSSTWTNSTQAGATTAKLSVSTNVNHHGYQYRCIVTAADGYEMISEAATLSIKPKISTSPASKTVVVGDTAVFSVAANGKTAFKYQWQYKSPGSTEWKNSTQNGAKTAKLSVTTNVNHQGYQYRCVVTDGNGQKNTSNAATLSIKPKITTQPTNKSVTVGTTVTLTVAANGKATLKYQWQYKSPGSNTWKDSTQTGAKTAKLTIKTNANHNGYQYRCVVKDGNGKTNTSDAAKLTVK